VSLFNKLDDKHLEEARQQVVGNDVVCPRCKASYSMSGDTLTNFNATLGLETHKCPHCGNVTARQRG
jgi:transposase-like protein